jgi:hypothetical protein
LGSLWFSASRASEWGLLESMNYFQRLASPSEMQLKEWLSSRIHLA